MEMIHELFKLPIKTFLEIAEHNEFLWVILALAGAFAILGQWVLYYKCSLPGISCLVPVWNVVVFLKIMGRPSWQIIFLMIPPPIIAYIIYTGDMSMVANIALISMSVIFLVFTIIVYIELCQCFGKNSISSYISVLLFNGLYVMYLGMSGETEYLGPVHGPKSIKNKPESAAS
ncbi:MAG: hypothetical protein KDC83_00830 [Flavobacteriales bacterium]|nr:hypothetical protein [Flavobacteriales bacterium]